MASYDIDTTREIIDRQFTRQLRAAFRLYDADLLDEDLTEEDQADAGGEECAAAEAHDDDDPMDVEDEVVTDDMRKVSLEQGDVDRYVSRELEDWDTINWVTWID
ncbi:hypothetical protein Q7P36_008230 [Cladosporium allicinum]|jgi:hypothetical protein